MTTRTPPQHIKHQRQADRRAELLKFAQWWLTRKPVGSIEQIVDRYLTENV